MSDPSLSNLNEQGNLLHYVVIATVIETCFAWLSIVPCNQLKSCLKHDKYKPIQDIQVVTKTDEMVIYLAYLTVHLVEKACVYGLVIPLLCYYLSLSQWSTCYTASLLGMAITIYRNLPASYLRSYAQNVCLCVICPIVTYYTLTQCLIVTNSLSCVLLTSFASSYIYYKASVSEIRAYQQEQIETKVKQC